MMKNCLVTQKKKGLQLNTPVSCEATARGVYRPRLFALLSDLLRCHSIPIRHREPPPTALFTLDELSTFPTSHSIPSSNPSPVFAEQGCMFHARSRMLIKSKPSLISSADKALIKSCLLANTSNGTPSSFSSHRSCPSSKAVSSILLLSELSITYTCNWGGRSGYTQHIQKPSQQGTFDE